MQHRPKSLNLFQVRLSINAIVSILHRISGMILFLILPFLLLAMYVSLESESGFICVVALMKHWLFKMFLIGVSWVFFHHFYAGLRHLCQDMNWMTNLREASYSGRIVLFLDLVSVMLFARMVW
ncbi:MAG: succinate dehydrogenase, cytochrome b556 subunit [Betaproteobacteria bacterium HGW-Betaproteobacteria-22]|nr:MAG: succinate dehydrogenase, cytochrome b556 subunit [Betaproteobacteria bacterium HGW-Betaproteobacteria-22]